METVLSIEGVRKAYGPIQALAGVSFEVPRGSVFGVLGPNGSGKTTLLGILLDVLKADSGSYSWLGGVRPEEARRRIGALLETPNFYHYMSAWDNLKVAAAIKQRGLEDRQKVLELVGLWQRKDSKFQTFSLGMKQRLAIGSALLGRPEVLVLDEPTNGLDPSGIAEIRDLILRLAAEGTTVIMASHLLDEVEKVCTHVAILKKGNLLVTGAVDDVLRSEDQIEVRSEDLPALERLLTAITGIRQVKQVGGQILHVSVDGSMGTADLNRICAQHGITLSHLVLRKKSLETKFMELIERS